MLLFQFSMSVSDEKKLSLSSTCEIRSARGSPVRCPTKGAVDCSDARKYFPLVSAFGVRMPVSQHMLSFLKGFGILIRTTSSIREVLRVNMARHPGGVLLKMLEHHVQPRDVSQFPVVMSTFAYVQLFNVLTGRCVEIIAAV
jgi:hypothetical protein